MRAGQRPSFSYERTSRDLPPDITQLPLPKAFCSSVLGKLGCSELMAAVQDLPDLPPYHLQHLVSNVKELLGGSSGELHE